MFELKGITADHQTITGTPEALADWAGRACDAEGRVWLVCRDGVGLYLRLPQADCLDPANWLEGRYVRPCGRLQAEAADAEAAAAAFRDLFGVEAQTKADAKALIAAKFNGLAAAAAAAGRPHCLVHGCAAAAVAPGTFVPTVLHVTPADSPVQVTFFVPAGQAGSPVNWEPAP